MKFTLSIDTDNAAFADDADREIARILRATANRITREGLSGFLETIHDENGNNVGRYGLDEPDNG